MDAGTTTYVADIPEAELLGFFAESLLFGVFTVLALISLWVLIYRQRQHGPGASVNVSMAVITIAMFLLAGAHLIIDIHRIIQGFTDHAAGGPGAFFARANDPTYIAKPILFAAVTAIGDGFMTYRVFVLWDRRPTIIVLPTLLILGTIVTGIGGAYEAATSPQSGVALLAPEAIAWTTAFLSLSLVANLVTTLLLLGRILLFARWSRGHQAGLTASVHWKVMKTVLCSEGIYSATLIVNLVVYLSVSSAVFAIMDVLPAVVGISFTLIILHIGLEKAVMGHSGSVHIIDSEMSPDSDSERIHRRERVLSPMEFTDIVCSSDTKGRSLELERGS